MTRFRMIIRTSVIIIAALLVGCCKQQCADESTATPERFEAPRCDVAALLSQNQDSTFTVLDNLEAAGTYPDCVIDLIRGNMYGQLMSLRFAEFYLRKAI